MQGRDEAGAGGGFGECLRELWMLEDGCRFLNHGSFGATPHEVLAAQDDWRRQMERQPVHFMVKVLGPALRSAASELAGFLGTTGENLVFVENATAGINAVLRSLRWEAGDEVLLTNHGYGAVRNAVRQISERYGVRTVEATVPFPIADPGEVVEALEGSLTSRTRLAIVDHVTSPTALVFPVEEVVRVCRDRGVMVLIDGAHAPGMLALDIERVGADFYAGNCHKWLFAPKGCGFLWAAPERQAGLHPPVVSWGYGEGFAKEFDWTGTRDPSAWLAITASLAFYKRLDPAALRSHNDALARWAARRLEAAWNTEPTAPPEMWSSMATIALAWNGAATREVGDRLHDRLVNEHRIEVPIIDFGGRLWVRVSAQAYNFREEYERLAEAMPIALRGL